MTGSGGLKSQNPNSRPKIPIGIVVKVLVLEIWDLGLGSFIEYDNMSHAKYSKEAACRGECLRRTPFVFADGVDCVLLINQ